MFLFPLAKYLGEGSLGCMEWVFNFIKISQTVLKSSCAILHFHQQCKSDRFFPSSPRFNIIILKMLVILIAVCI